MLHKKFQLANALVVINIQQTILLFAISTYITVQKFRVSEIFSLIEQKWQ